MSSKLKTETSKVDFALAKENYYLIIIGCAIILLGFLLMVGGRAEDPKTFNADVIFSFRRVTLAPIVVMIGFIFEIYAIMKKPKEDKQ